PGGDRPGRAPAAKALEIGDVPSEGAAQHPPDRALLVFVARGTNFGCHPGETSGGSRGTSRLTSVAAWTHPAPTTIRSVPRGLRRARGTTPDRDHRNAPNGHVDGHPGPARFRVAPA